MEGHKDKIRIATKWGPMFTEAGYRMDASPANCRACAEGSLKRLGVPAIDLFTMRGPVDPKVPLEETMAEVKVGEVEDWSCILSQVGSLTI